MRIFYGIDNLPRFLRPAVTVGSFDGVHAAHRLLLDTVRSAARAMDGESVVATFDPHPRFVLEGESCPMRLLTSLEERMSLLAEAGVDNVIVIPFTREFSRTSSADFERWLTGDVGAEIIVAGYNHHFGHNKQGGARELAGEAGVEVLTVECMNVEGHKVSSSVIREMVLRGDMAGAQRLLGYRYFVTGRFAEGSPEGGMAEFAADEPRKLLPPRGEYRVALAVCDSDGGERRPGAAHEDLPEIIRPDCRADIQTSIRIGQDGRMSLPVETASELRRTGGMRFAAAFL